MGMKKAKKWLFLLYLLTKKTVKKSLFKGQKTSESPKNKGLPHIYI